MIAIRSILDSRRPHQTDSHIDEMYQNVSSFHVVKVVTRHKGIIREIKKKGRSSMDLKGYLCMSFLHKRCYGDFILWWTHRITRIVSIIVGFAVPIVYLLILSLRNIFFVVITITRSFHDIVMEWFCDQLQKYGAWTRYHNSFVRRISWTFIRRWKSKGQSRIYYLEPEKLWETFVLAVRIYSFQL